MFKLKQTKKSSRELQKPALVNFIFRHPTHSFKEILASKSLLESFLYTQPKDTGRREKIKEFHSFLLFNWKERKEGERNLPWSGNGPDWKHVNLHLSNLVLLEKTEAPAACPTLHKSHLYVDKVRAPNSSDMGPLQWLEGLRHVYSLVQISEE